MKSRVRIQTVDDRCRITLGSKVTLPGAHYQVRLNDDGSITLLPLPW